MNANQNAVPEPVPLEWLLGDNDVKTCRAPSTRELTGSVPAYSYALNELCKPWPEGEAVIALSPNASFLYARDLIKGRWPAGEESILRDPITFANYIHQAVRERLPELEDRIMDSPAHLYYYARDVIRGPWPKAELKLATSSEFAYSYATLTRKRFEIGEEVIAKSYFAQLYLQSFPEARVDWALYGWCDWF